MMNRNDITNVAKKMMRQHRGLQDPKIIHPARDWSIGVVIAVISFTVIAWWSTVSYLKHSKTIVEGSVETVTTDSVYREEQVKSSLGIFAKRKEEFLRLKNSAEPIAVEEVVSNEEEATVTEEISEEPVSVPTDNTENIEETLLSE